MGFVIQWLVCLVAFVGGSAVAFGIATLLRNARGERSEPETSPAAEPEPLEPEVSEEQASDSVVEPEPDAGVDAEPEVSDPQWPGPPSAWPGIGARR